MFKSLRLLTNLKSLSTPAYNFSKVSINQIKELRNITGSSIDECKKALEAVNGDIEKAMDFLKQRGLASADKKASRTASEGIVAIKYLPDRSSAVLVEVNCETDFVAKNEMFLSFTDLLLNTLITGDVSKYRFLKQESGTDEEIDAILKGNTGNMTIEGTKVNNLHEAKQMTISKLAENIKVRRLGLFNRDATPSVIGHYVHQTYKTDVGKSLCILELSTQTENEAAIDLASNLAMQIMGNKPKYLTREHIPKEALDEAIAKAKADLGDALNKKPANVVEKMVEGKLKKNLEESVLYYQEYMFQEGKTVEQFLKEQEKELNTALKINKFLSFELGGAN